MFDKNAFVMIIIPFENRLLQFDSPCNLLNYLLFVSNIYLFFWLFLSIPALFYFFFFYVCDWFLCADPDQLSDPALMMVAPGSMWKWLSSRCPVCFALRFTPLCICRFFHIPQSVLGQNCSHLKPENNDWIKSVHQGNVRFVPELLIEKLTSRMQRVGRIIAVSNYNLWSVLNYLISESIASIVSFLFALVFTAFFLLILH